MKKILLFVLFAVSAFGQNRILRDISCTATTASGTTYACSPPVDPGAYRAGEIYSFRADVANTGSASIAFGTHGAVTMKKWVTASLTTLAGNDIGPGQWVAMRYDGTFMQVLSLGGGGGGVTGAVIKYFGTAAPGSVAGNLPGDEFSDTTNHNIYECNAPSATAAPACTSVTAGGWTLLNTTAGAGAVKYFGTAAPGSVGGNLPGDLFSDTTNHVEYWCNAPSGTAAPACTSVSAGGWTNTAGSGGLPAPGGSQSVLISDGIHAPTWGNLPTGGSGGLDCVTIPGECDTVPAVLSYLANTEVATGLKANQPSANQPITAVTNTINPNANVIQVTPSANWTLTSTPTISSVAHDGTRLVILNISTANTLTLQDEAILSGTTLDLCGANYTVGVKQSIAFTSNAGKWVKEGNCGGGTGGGSTSSKGVFASLPAAGNAGNTYYATDGFCDAGGLRDNGSTWDCFVKGILVTLPPQTGWTTLGSGATMTASGSGMNLMAPAGPTGQVAINSLHAISVTAPYSIIIGWVWDGGDGTNQHDFCGVAIADGTSGSAHVISVQNGSDLNSNAGVWEWTGTAITAYTFGPAATFWAFGGAVTWVKIYDDGTNRHYSISGTGRSWTQWYSEANTTFLSGNPTYAGLICSSGSATANTSATIVSFSTSGQP